MNGHTQGSTLLGMPDRFVAVEIETATPPAFDAAQYSFFGDLSAADSGLEGALEDGLEAPPPEDGLSCQDYGVHGGDEDILPLDEEVDLSVASIFREQLGLGVLRTRRVDPDDDAALDALLTDPLSVARKQLHDNDYDHRELPSEMYSEAVSAMHLGQPQSSLFNSTTGSYSLFDGHGSVLGGGGVASMYGCSSGHMTTPQAPRHPASAPEPGLLQMLKKPSPQPFKARTLEEVESQMLRDAEATAVSAESASSRGSFGDCMVVPDTLAAAGPNQKQQAAFLTRPLPGTPINNSIARGHIPRMTSPTAGHAPPPGASLPNQIPPPLQQHPVNHHGLAPQGMQQQQQQLIHGAVGPQGHLHGHMMPPPSGEPGHTTYPPPPMMAGPTGHLDGGPLPPNTLVYTGNGTMMPQQHQHHSSASPGVQYPTRGPMPPYGPGPMGMVSPPQYMHDGFLMRSIGGQPGTPGHMPAMSPRPGVFVYGSHALDSVQSPGHHQQLPGVRSQRPPILPGPSVLQPGNGGHRPGPTESGASGPQLAIAPLQSVSTDFGHQVTTGNTAPGPLGSREGPLAAASGRADGAPTGPGGRLGGKWMRPDDVEYVVRSMLYSVANGVPYVEDYYYQAFVHKHVSQPSRQQLSPGAFPMAAPFVPEALRELSEDQMSMMRMGASARTKFVEGLQGLGKIVLSNIRTPKVLMDLTDRSGGKGVDDRAPSLDPADGDGTDQHMRSSRPLEQEPLLAARIMIEDCINLLLDMDDVDRLANHMAARAQAQQRAVAVVAALPLPGRPTSATAAMTAAMVSGVNAPCLGPYGPSSVAAPPVTQLRERRELLLAGINGAFRLASSPTGDAENDLAVEDGGDVGASSQLGDGVLIRILALPKGRSVVSRALLAIAPPASLVAALPVISTQRPQQPQPEKLAAAITGSGGGSVPMPVVQDSVSSSGDAQAAVGNVEGAGGNLLIVGAPNSYVLLWGTLRNAWMIFGSSLQQDMDSVTERPFIEATTRLAVALREALLRLPTPRDVVEAAAAFNAGCKKHVDALSLTSSASSMELTLLPLAQTRAAEPAPPPPPPPSSSAGPSSSSVFVVAPAAWLGEALAALVTRASQLGLTSAGGADREADAEGMAVEAHWQREYAVLHQRVARHLTTLSSIHDMAVASNNAEALAVVRALSCRLLLNAMLQHASLVQAEELRTLLPALVS